MNRQSPITDPVTVEIATLDALNNALGSAMTLAEYRHSKALGHTSDQDVRALIASLPKGPP